MKLHANAQTCPHCRALIVSRVLDDHVPPATVALDFRVSTRTVHKWVRRFRAFKCLYLSWDSAPWHRSERLLEHLSLVNAKAEMRLGPKIKVLPLPTSAQFLNVIESVYSGMARAIPHNSNYATVEEAQSAIDRHFRERNEVFMKHPRKAGNKIWRSERVPATFSETNNCKDARWMGWSAKA